jgi:hypothetical protein
VANRFERWGLSFPALIASATATPTFGLLVSATHGDAKHGWTVGVVAAGATTGLIGWLRDRAGRTDRKEIERAAGEAAEQAKLAQEQEEAARAIAERLTLTLRDGSSLISVLGQLCAGDGPDEAGLTRLQERVLDAARRLGDRQDNRASIYVFTDPDRLVLKGHRGRPDEPRELFIRSDVPYGRSVLEFADGLHPAQPPAQRYPDLVHDAPPGFGDPKARSYRTLIAVRIKPNGQSLGLLTLDSPVAGSLAASDISTMILLGKLLGAGMAVTRRNVDGVQAAAADHPIETSSETAQTSFGSREAEQETGHDSSDYY